MKKDYACPICEKPLAGIFSSAFVFAKHIGITPVQMTGYKSKTSLCCDDCRIVVHVNDLEMLHESYKKSKEDRIKDRYKENIRLDSKLDQLNAEIREEISQQ